MSDNAENDIPSRLRRILDRIEALLLGSEKSKAGRKRLTPPATRAAIMRGLRVVSLICSVALFAAFVFATSYYASTRKRIEENPSVVNLTKLGVKAKVHFGASPDCGGVDCWLQPVFDDSAWDEITVPLNPNANIKSLKDYPEGLRADRMYYRLRIPIPSELLRIEDEISFTPLYVQHNRFEVFINGRLVYSSTNANAGLITNYPIARSDVVDGHVNVAFRTTVAVEDVGITHRSSALLGPKAALDDLFVHAERALFTYYLLFILTKGGIFVVFTLFFYFTRSQPGFVQFLLFAFFSTLENLFIGDFLASSIPLSTRVLLYFSFKATAIAGLLGFVMHFYRATHARRVVQAIAFLALSAVVSLSYDHAWGTKTVTVGDLILITNSLLVAAVAFGIVLGLLNDRRWRKRKASGPQLDSIRRLTAFLAVYLIGIVWEFYFKEYGGFDKRPILDLAFFICLALNTAIDMGLQEGKITTLEAHMEEKRRMELELQEAAEIAKAFLPHQTPIWPALAIQAFHKPLTENSGDWFAFEQSRSGRFFHFIICDITGHGVQAAIVVSTARSVLSFYLHTHPERLDDPQFILDYMRNLNATLWSNGGGYHVLTLLGITFEPAARQLHYISAGHPSPIIVPAPNPEVDGRPRPLISRANVLGISPTFDGAMKTHPFNPGDDLITFTDGLPVSSNVKALRTFLAARGSQGKSPEALFQRVWESERARTSQTVNDDVSIVWFTAS